MTSSLCTLGNYVIDWYVDSILNPIEFTSGNTGNTDPAIQQFHPFTGASARPSIGGSWIPIIRYAYLDSIKYTSTITPGASYASDLATCLTPINVLNLNCSNGTNTDVGFEQYTHKFNYTNGVSSPSDASKSLGFDLNSDGSTQYMAWYFAGNIISDRITFTYVSPLNATSTLMQDFAIGTDIPATDFTGVIKKVNQSYSKYIIDLTAITYAVGDYILIDITAGYIAPTNPNTNWTAYFACLTTFDTSWTKAVIDPCSAVMTYSTGLCAYNLTYGFSTFNDNKTTDRYKYLVTSYDTNGVTNITPTFSQSFSNGQQSCSYGNHIHNYNETCVQAAGTITVTKTGPSFVFQFSSITDYNKYQSEYNDNIAWVTPAGPTPPSSDINYYRFLQTFVTKYLNDNCGDTRTSRDAYMMHYLTPVTFDSIAQTMSFTITAVDGSPFFATVGACAGSCAALDLLQQNNNYAASVTNKVVIGTTTTVKFQAAYYYEQTAPVVTFLYSAAGGDHIAPYSPVYAAPLTNGWYYNSPNYQAFHFFHNAVTITDSLDGVNNFKIQSDLDVNGKPTGVYVTIYEISGGVVTTPSGGCS